MNGNNELKNLAPYIEIFDENCNELLSILAYTTNTIKLDLVKEIGAKMRRNAEEALEVTGFDTELEKEFRSILVDFVFAGNFYSKGDIMKASYWIRSTYKKYEIFWQQIFPDELNA